MEGGLAVVVDVEGFGVGLARLEEGLVVLVVLVVVVSGCGEELEARLRGIVVCGPWL